MYVYLYLIAAIICLACGPSNARSGCDACIVLGASAVLKSDACDARDLYEEFTRLAETRLAQNTLNLI